MTDSAWEQQLRTSVHELMHALGFSNNDFNKYIDRRTGKRYSADVPPGADIPGVIVSSTARGHKVSHIVLPTVVAEARAHFGCASLKGAEVEDGGSPGSAGSHLEKRVFFNDVMSPSSDPNSPSYSRVSLAVLHDSGWYDADFSKATVLTWGRNAGCAFAGDYCLSGGRVVAGGDKYFCTPPATLPAGKDDRRCTHDRMSVGVCSVVSYTSSLPSYYQYFPDPRKVSERVPLSSSCVCA